MTSTKNKLLPLVLAFVVTMLSLASPAPADAATIECGVSCEPTEMMLDVESDDQRRPGDLTSDDGPRVESVSPYTEYCLKKYPFDPEKAYECSMGWVVD